jgi:type II secretory pathway component PulC
MGKNSVTIQSETRRSKNEMYFAELCKLHFSNVETNQPIFNGWDCDVILNDQKIAVMWNGKWHYEKITKQHSVNQVQNRDKIKLNEIIKCGYTPYVIKDRGGEDKLFVESEFKKFVGFLLTF